VDTGKDNYIPKDIVFVFDRTGSMSGEKIEQARNALKFCLRSLNPKDRFNVIPFNEEPDPMFDSMENATNENVESAVEKVNDIESLGGTNIDEALKTAFKMKSGSDRPVYVLFLTDGQPTVGITDTETILKNAGGRAPDSVRMFVFGVGYDVNTHLLDKLSSQNRGASEYVKPGEDIEVKVSDLFRMISSPVLTNVAVDYGSMDAYDRVPSQLPDLFKGTQLIIAGRFRNTGRSAIRLTGTADGKKREFKLNLDIPDYDDNTFIPSLWASRRIGVLQDEIRLHGENRELIGEIVRLSKRYGIITEYTSFLVEEREARIASGGKTDAYVADNVKRKLSSASAETSGSWAVNQSVNNMNLAGAAQAPASIQTYFDKGGNTVEIKNVQNVNGLAFFNDKNVWTDSRYNKDIKIVKIKPFSEAHLALIKTIPELASIFSQGEQVLIVIGKTAVQTDPHGVEKLTEEQLKGFEKNRAKLM
jgi:Ca-activated chloride channel family protein